jgi:excisionase family DNA binding protein
MEHKEYLTIQEVCEVLKLSRWTVSDLIKSGKIKGSKIGKSYRVERKAIDDFINDMAV